MISDNNCPFCKLNINQSVAGSKYGLAVRDGFPISLGHTLVIPRRHVASFFDLSSDEQSNLLSLINEVKKQLDNDFHPHGYNIGINDGQAAGQTVMHLHIHIIPRYEGDVPDPRGGIRLIFPEKANYWDEDVLEITSVPYPESQLEAWKTGDYSMLTSSNASNYLKKILISKAQTRPGSRFFGEAFVASTQDMSDGWYSSYKWLTSDKWITGKNLKPEFENPFYHALMKHIGKDALKDLQERSLALFDKQKEMFRKGNKYGKPVAPDLWLINKEGAFKFIEVKLPWDTVNSHQIAGLALIKKYLRLSSPVSVSILNLHPENSDPTSKFAHFYNLA